MAYLDNVKDFSLITAFGEQKVAQYTPMAEWSFRYNINAVLIETPETVSTGTVEAEDATSSALLQTGTASDGEAKIRTAQGLRYHPGIGALSRFTAIFTQGAANSEQFIGLMDTIDNIGFGYNGEQFGIHYTAYGEYRFIPDTEFSQRCTYTKMKHDPTKLNVYQIQFQWLGGGELRFYIEGNQSGSFELVHVIRYANTETRPSFAEASFRIGAYVKNTGNTTNVALRTPSATAGVEGYDNPRPSAVYLGTDNTKAVSTSAPVISLRNNDTYQGKQNRTTVSPRYLSLSCVGNRGAIFRAWQQPTLTGANFIDVSPTISPASVDKAATARTGGLPAGTFVVGPNSSQIVNISDLIVRIIPGRFLTLTAESTQTATAVDVTVGILFASEF